MAATVATAKIILRIMGLSSLLLDVLAHPASQSGEPTGGFNGAAITPRVLFIRGCRLDAPPVARARGFRLFAVGAAPLQHHSRTAAPHHRVTHHRPALPRV